MWSAIARMAVGSLFKSYIFWLVLFLGLGGTLIFGFYSGLKYAKGAYSRQTIAVYERKIDLYKDKAERAAKQNKIDMQKEQEIRDTGQEHARTLREAAITDPSLGGRRAGDVFMQAWVDANKGLEADGSASEQGSRYWAVAPPEK